MPRETALGDGVRGVENGCPALVDVAGGGLDGVTVGAEEVKVRRKVDGIRSADARCKQRWQIMVVLLE